MKRHKLGEICEIVSGSTPQTSIDEYWDGDLKWITPAELNDETFVINDSVRKITKLGAKKTGLSPFPKGTVILSSRAPIGKVAIAGCEMYCNQGFKNMICSEKINNRYLYWFLKGKTAFLNSLGRGATFKEISKKIVADIEINVPDLEQQLSVVEDIEKVSKIIKFRKRELQKLDDLVKARFVEMFGDPVSNSLGWKTDYLKKVTSKIGSGATPKGGKESYQAEGITLIRSMNVHDGRFEYKDLAHITDEQAKQLDNVTIEENDVFINITGASVARSCIVPKHVLPARVNQHVAIIRCITSVLNPVFSNNMFLNQSFKGQLLDIGETGGATRQAITKQQLETLEVILPPIELQNQFAAFVEQVDKSKAAVQMSLDKLQILFDKLMQEYFG